MTNLDTLISRVRELKGPDRDIDTYICDIFGTWVPFVGMDVTAYRTKIGELYIDVTRQGRSTIATSDRYVARYTASLDATVSLIERELPGQWKRLVTQAMLSCGDINMLPLALLLATLTAIKERDA